MKKHVKNGKNVSMGFGFIEFDSVETATNVCKDLQVILLAPELMRFSDSIHMNSPFLSLISICN